MSLIRSSVKYLPIKMQAQLAYLYSKRGLANIAHKVALNKTIQYMHH